MAARWRSSSWPDRIGVLLGVLVVVVTVLIVLRAVVRSVGVTVRMPVLAVVSEGAAVVVLAVGWAGMRIVAPRRSRVDQLWRSWQPLARHDLAGYRNLLELLSRHPAADLPPFSDWPAALDGLIFHARRGDLRVELQPFADRVRGVARPRPDAVAWALAGLHADGHVREAAVAGMASRPLPGYVPFLVERAVDWVEPVRVRALAALDELPDRYRPLVVRELARVAARRHAAALVERFGKA